MLYEPALERLKGLVEATGAKIVVSSSWRQVPSAYANLTAWLEKFGMNIADKKPYVGRCRGDDITAWLKRNPGEYSYAILDDDEDMGEHMNHLIRIEFDVGLTEEDFTKALALLTAEV